MISIKIFLNGLYVEGHAFFAKKGKDIICSATSAIIQGFIKSFDDDQIDQYKIDQQKPSIYFKTKENISKNSLKIIETQLKCIYHSSENYLKLEIINKKMEQYYGK